MSKSLDDKVTGVQDTRALLEDVNSDGKYNGEYVAIASDKEGVIAHGKDPGKVIAEARKKGVEVPAIVYIFEPNITYDLIAA